MNNNYRERQRLWEEEQAKLKDEYEDNLEKHPATELIKAIEQWPACGDDRITNAILYLLKRARYYDVGEL